MEEIFFFYEIMVSYELFNSHPLVYILLWFSAPSISSWRSSSFQHFLVILVVYLGTRAISLFDFPLLFPARGMGIYWWSYFCFQQTVFNFYFCYSISPMIDWQCSLCLWNMAYTAPPLFLLFSYFISLYCYLLVVSSDKRYKFGAFVLEDC